MITAVVAKPAKAVNNDEAELVRALTANELCREAAWHKRGKRQPSTLSAIERRWFAGKQARVFHCVPLYLAQRKRKTR
jgi:hypothetical protein